MDYSDAPLLKELELPDVVPIPEIYRQYILSYSSDTTYDIRLAVAVLNLAQNGYLYERIPLTVFSKLLGPSAKGRTKNWWKEFFLRHQTTVLIDDIQLLDTAPATVGIRLNPTMSFILNPANKGKPAPWVKA